MKKAIQQAKKRARVHEFPDVGPGAWTSSPSTFAHLSNGRLDSEHKRPRTEDPESSNLAGVAPALSSVSEPLADKDVLARVPKPQVSTFADCLMNLLNMRLREHQPS